MKIKNKLAELENADLGIFGKVDGNRILYGYPIWTDAERLKGKDEVTITNSDCEFEFDAITSTFEKNLSHCFICDIEIIDVDLSGYIPGKSNNGGGYAFAICEVLKVYENG